MLRTRVDVIGKVWRVALAGYNSVRAHVGYEIEILTVSLSYPVVRDGRGRCEELLTQPELRHVTEIVTNPLLR